MADRPLSVLFLCTGNSARSQLAEAVLRHLSHGKVRVESAGSAPQPQIHPMARLAARRVLSLEMDGQRPKLLDQFLGERFDYVITVCDRAAESCPVFPGNPERIHWGLEDPAAARGTEEERQRAFDNVARELMNRIRLWMALIAPKGDERHIRPDARGRIKESDDVRTSTAAGPCKRAKTKVKNGLGCSDPVKK